jgi:hypothetical protein
MPNGTFSGLPRDIYGPNGAPAHEVIVMRVGAETNAAAVKTAALE